MTFAVLDLPARTGAFLARLLRPGRAAGIVAALGALSACGGDDGDWHYRDSSLTASEACSQFVSGRISASAIGLPTTGAEIRSATLVLATDAGNANGDYCKVLAAIHPVDATAPDINLEVNLPSRWNGKAMQRGGGGYDGSLVTGLNQIPYGPTTGPTPLANGYVTLGSDSGHVGSTADGSFALNAEALANFGGEQLKKTHDVAMVLMRSFYGASPAHFYFVGNSQGGHEGFIVAQRWPRDYDGVIAIHPVYDFTLLQLDGNHLAQIVYANGGSGWLNPSKIALLQNAVMSACDALDGATDGVISNTAGCAARFSLASLRCPGGADTGNGCLSDAQIASVNAINSRYSPGLPLAGGIDSFARWPILEGADWSGIFGFGTRPQPSSPPTPLTDFGLHVLSDPMVRFFVTRNPTVDSLAFDPSAWVGRIQEVSRLVDANSADLSAFRARGGRMLLMHGTVDSAVSPYNSVDYYQRLVAQFGQASLDGFLRFYLTPGFGHGTGQFIAAWDSLAALEAWVERGTAPGPQIVTDSKPGNNGRTRPLCVYPSWPRYNGAGDVNAAVNFSCSTS